MRFRTRRILEIFIILVTLAVFIDLKGLGTGAVRDDTARLDLVRDIYREELSARYSPGDRAGYRLLFGHKSTSRIPGTEEVIDWSSIHNVIYGYYIGGGFEAVPEAPDWFHHELDRTEAEVEYLRQVLGTGPYVAAPSSESLLNYLYMQWAAKTLRMLAVRDWLRGNEERSTEYLSTVFDLGDSLEPSCILISHLIRLQLYGIGVEGFDSLTWTDPGPADNVLILTALGNAVADEWQIPPHGRNTLSDALLYSSSFTKNPIASLDYYAASSVLLGSLTASGESETGRLLREAGIPRSARDSFFEVFDRMSRWTTIPAMRRRARRIPESFYESDPWMSAESAKRMPPLLYLLSRVDPPDNRYSVEESLHRLDVVRWKTWAIKNAYRVRVWRDEQGRWPTTEEFGILLRAGSGLDFHVLTDPAPLMNRFLAVHNADPIHRAGFTWNWNPQSPSQITAVVFSEPKGVRGHDQTRLEELAANSDLAAWLAGILRIPNFVESVDVEAIKMDESVPRSQPRSRVTAHLRLPEKSYWITHPGPDGEPDGPGLVYDPTNGTTSRGDIVQLAGWEY